MAGNTGSTAGASKQPPAPSTNRTTSAEGVRRYFRESRIELRKVNWPTREQTTNLTIVVVVVCVVIALFLGGVDVVFTNIISKISAH
jgi:preprotein translocase subunit SecE